MKTWVLWILTILIIIGTIMSRIIINKALKMKSEIKSLEKQRDSLFTRIRITDKYDSLQSKKIDTLIQVKHDTKTIFLKEKATYQLLDADSSVSLLSESLRQYAATKDSL